MSKPLPKYVIVSVLGLVQESIVALENKALSQNGAGSVAGISGIFEIMARLSNRSALFVDAFNHPAKAVLTEDNAVEFLQDMREELASCGCLPSMGPLVTKFIETMKYLDMPLCRLLPERPSPCLQRGNVRRKNEGAPPLKLIR